MGGDSKFSVPVGPRRGQSRMGENLRKKSDWSQNCLLNAKLGHFYLSMKYSFLRYFWVTRLRQIWQKNVFKFVKFSGMNLGWGGDKHWSKNWDMCRMGELAKFLPDGGPPRPPGKKKPWTQSGYIGPHCLGIVFIDNISFTQSVTWSRGMSHMSAIFNFDFSV